MSPLPRPPQPLPQPRSSSFPAHLTFHLSDCSAGYAAFKFYRRRSSLLSISLSSSSLSKFNSISLKCVADKFSWKGRFLAQQKPDVRSMILQMNFLLSSSVVRVVGQIAVHDVNDCPLVFMCNFAYPYPAISSLH